MSIEYGIPIPIGKGGESPFGKIVREKMDQLLINGSFFQPCKNVSEEHLTRSTVGRVIIRTYNRERHFTTRKVFEGSQVGIRVWRVK